MDFEELCVALVIFIHRRSSCLILASHTLLTVAGQVGIDIVSARDSPHLSARDALNTVDTAFLLTSFFPQHLKASGSVSAVRSASLYNTCQLYLESIYDLNSILIFLSEIHQKQYELV